MYAVAAHFRLLNGAKAIGKTVDGNLYTYYYYKDGAVVAVAFCNNGTARQKLPASCSVLDMSGNPVKIENGEVLIGLNPVYILGLDKETAMTGAGNQIRDEFELFIDYYANLMGEEQEYNSLPGKFFDDSLSNSAHSSSGKKNMQQCLDYMMNTEEDAFGYDIIKEKVASKIDEYFALTKEGLPSAEELEAYINSYYDMGIELMEDYKAGRIHMSAREFSGLMYSLHFIGEYMANVYMMSVPSNEVLQIPSSSAELKHITAAIDQKESRTEGGIYEFSRAILSYGNNYASEAEEVFRLSESNPQKAGVVKSRNLMAENLNKWAQNFMDCEGISHSRMLLQMTRENRTFYNFSENTAVFSLYNFGKKDFEGTIKLYDSEGTELLSVPAQLAAGKSAEFKGTFLLSNTTENRSLYTIRLYSGDELYYEEVIDDIAIAEKAVITMNTSMVPAEQLTEVSFNVENTFNTEQQYVVRVIPPEGWALEENEKTVSIKPGQTSTVSFNVEKTHITDFNEYYFDVELTASGDETVKQNDLPLQFTYVPKTNEDIDINAFNGDISDWKNAYPVIVNVPENPSDPESWANANRALRLYAKWSAGDLYLLARVNDDKMLNDRVETEIWNGDSIQFSIDTTNSKTAFYDDGDYEFGLALTGAGMQHYVWTGASGGFNNMEYKIIRNEQDRTTLYLIKIPADALSPMRFIQGYEFGMNVVLNDADSVSREFFAELTDGTAYEKAPIYYHTWILGN